MLNYQYQVTIRHKGTTVEVMPVEAENGLEATNKAEQNFWATRQPRDYADPVTHVPAFITYQARRVQH